MVASKIDTEGSLLGQMIAAVLEAKGLAVERKIHNVDLTADQYDDFQRLAGRIVVVDDIDDRRG